MEELFDDISDIDTNDLHKFSKYCRYVSAPVRAHDLVKIGKFFEKVAFYLEKEQRDEPPVLSVPKAEDIVEKEPGVPAAYIEKRYQERKKERAKNKGKRIPAARFHDRVRRVTKENEA